MKKTLYPILAITLVTAFTIGSTLMATGTNAFGGLGGQNGFHHGPGMMSGMMPFDEADDAENGTMEKNVTTDVTKTDTGITINKSSTDAATVKKLHDMADRMTEQKSITRTVTNISNGVEITMTSTLPDVVTKLQTVPDAGKTPPKNDLVKTTRENLSNGVKITITSDNPDQVKKIQNPSHQGQQDGKRGIGRQQKPSL